MEPLLPKQPTRKNGIKHFKQDTINLLSDMFAEVRKSTFCYDDDGYPCSVEFVANKADYSLKYEGTMRPEHTDNVTAKREYIPELEFLDKHKEPDIGFILKFKINRIKTVMLYSNKLAVI